VAEADVLFVATPHAAYRGLAVPPGRVVVDVWDVVGAEAARRKQGAIGKETS
jgi:hypothetical protein